MNRMLFNLFVCFLAVFSFKASTGTHIMGVDMTYKQINSGVYEVKIVIYRDCNGIKVGASNFVAKSASDTIIGDRLPQVSIRDITGIGQNCNVKSICAGGTFSFGVEEVTLIDTLDFSPYSECEWDISWNQCCRNVAINTGASNQYFHERILINKCVSNSSPEYSVLPIVYVVANEDVVLSLGTLDTIDSYDSISYHLVPPLQDDTTSVLFAGNYKYYRPLRFEGFPDENAAYPGGFRVSPHTGDLLFRPTQVNQIAIFVIEVREYKKINGVQTIIGKTRRDMQIIVLPNYGQSRTPHITSYYQGLYSVCVGDSLVIPIQSADSNATDSTFITFNSGIPAGTYQSNNGSVKNALGTFSWKPSASDVRNGSHTFTFSVFDNSCNLPRIIHRTIHIFVKDSLPAPHVAVDADYIDSMNLSSFLISATIANQENRIAIWRTTGDGYFLDSFSNSTQYVPGPIDQLNCSYQLMRGIWDNQHCFDSTGKWSDTMQVLKYYEPVNAGPDRTVKFGDSILLSSMWNYNVFQYGTWRSSGDGIFIDSLAKSTYYKPGASDMSSCSWEIILRLKNGYCEEVYDTLTVSRELGYLRVGSNLSALKGDTLFIQASSDSSFAQLLRWRSSGNGQFGDSTASTTWYLPGSLDYDSCKSYLIVEEYPYTGCESKADTLEFVKSIPFFEAGSGVQLFYGDTAQLGALPTANTNYQFGYWTSAGDGIFLDSNDANTRYIPGNDDWSNCGTTLYWNEIDSYCGARVDSVKILRVTSNVLAGNDQSSYFNPGMSFSLQGWSDTANAQSAYWTSSGDGMFSDTFALNATYTPGSNDLITCLTTLTLVGYPTGTCTVYDEMELEILDSAVRILNVSVDSMRFDTVHISIFSVDGRGSLNWTSSGSGSFVNTTWNSAAYVLSASDKQSNLVTLNIEYQAPCLNSTDQVAVHPQSIKPNGLLLAEKLIRIYPNPANEFVMIEWEGDAREIQIEVYNGIGQQLQVNHKIENALQLDVRSLPPGTYWIRISAPNGQTQSVSFIKNK